MWVEICFFAAVILLAAGVFTAFRLLRAPYKRGRLLTPVRCVMVGVFLAGVLLFVPIHAQQLERGVLGIIKSVLLSIHSVMRLFVLDGEFDCVSSFTACLSNGAVCAAYSFVTALLYVLAPVLTFGFVLSFFQNISAYRDLLIRRRSELFVFSELNERALVLAASLQKKDPGCCVVFMDVFDNNDETSFELGEQAKERRAICFKKDIADINWKRFAKNGQISLFAIGEDEAENIAQSIKLSAHYGTEPNFRLFVFSSSAESEVLFNKAIDGGMRIRRINDVRSLINQLLYRQGDTFFEHAVPDGEEKLISVVIVGLGQYGTQMLKALAWYCQMDGYRVQIHAFDQDPAAENRFRMLCPELMAPERNGTCDPGEAQYHITIHGGVDLESIEFADTLREIGAVSHVFVSLGEDGKNIQTAIQTRILCERNGQKPVIQAVVHDSLKKQSLADITDYRGHPYDIDFIGDLESSYSEEVIIDSELENIALQRHLKWGKESDFWAFEFNYRSSVAAAIHLKARVQCGIPGADKKGEDLTEEERYGIESLEHRRWNAYMRSEGYVYSGSTAKSSRNDLAKLHCDLVPFDVLSEETKRKDSRVGTA